MKDAKYLTSVAVGTQTSRSSTASESVIFNRKNDNNKNTYRRFCKGSGGEKLEHVSCEAKHRHL